MILALVFMVFFGAGATSFAEDLTGKHPLEGNADINVTLYRVKARIPVLQAGDLRISEAISLRARSDIKTLDFHVSRPTVRILSVSDSEGDLPHEILQAPTSPDGGTNWVARVHLSRVIRAGQEMLLRFELSTKVGCYIGGLAFRKRGASGPTLMTQSFPHHTREWLVTNDHPSDPARFELELHVPEEFVTASVGDLLQGTLTKGSGLDSQGLRIFKWRTPRAIPTYLMFFAVSQFEVHQSRYDGLPVATYIGANDPEHDQRLKATREALGVVRFLRERIGEFPFPKLGVAWVDHRFSMEYPSLIAVNDPSALVHELVHQWWGDSVRYGHWGEFWISEGFTTYFTGLYEELHGSGRNTACRGRDTPLDRAPTTYPSGTYAYCTGASALHDLRLRLGAHLYGPSATASQSADAFLVLMRELYQSYQGRILSTKELLRFLQQRLPGDLVQSWADKWFRPGI